MKSIHIFAVTAGFKFEEKQCLANLRKPYITDF